MYVRTCVWEEYILHSINDLENNRPWILTYVVFKEVPSML